LVSARRSARAGACGEALPVVVPCNLQFVVASAVILMQDAWIVAAFF
jgi:hypothetical protein